VTGASDREKTPGALCIRVGGSNLICWSGGDSSGAAGTKVGKTFSCGVAKPVPRISLHVRARLCVAGGSSRMSADGRCENIRRVLEGGSVANFQRSDNVVASDSARRSFW